MTQLSEPRWLRQMSAEFKTMTLEQLRDFDREWARIRLPAIEALRARALEIADLRERRQCRATSGREARAIIDRLLRT